MFIATEPGGYARVFFQQAGERRVPITALQRAVSWEEQVVSHVRAAVREAVERLWLALEAEQLPLMDSAATLTAAKVDLLPHQIVLTYRIANASPRRFLVADSVGLGKTIETALILRELASRGELTRAHDDRAGGPREQLAAGIERDVPPRFRGFRQRRRCDRPEKQRFRQTQPADRQHRHPEAAGRVKRILEAPRWDLIVFDEAHHLTAYRIGNKVDKTQNFKLAEDLRDHGRECCCFRPHHTRETISASGC